jgi:hypothetical protein
MHTKSRAIGERECPRMRKRDPDWVGAKVQASTEGPHTELYVIDDWRHHAVCYNEANAQEKVNLQREHQATQGAKEGGVMACNTVPCGGE